jgi:hypothetical protein
LVACIDIPDEDSVTSAASASSSSASASAFSSSAAAAHSDDDDGSLSASTQFRGFSLLESKLGGSYLGVGLTGDNAKQCPLLSMHLEEDGVPYENMLWNFKPDGSLENRVNGLVLQVKNDGENVVVCGQRKLEKNGSLKAACKWMYTPKGELVNEASEYLLTVRNGSRENFAEVWCNFRPPKVGKLGGASKAQRWIFSAFNGVPKPASSAPKISKQPTTGQLVKHHLKFLLGV